MNLEPLLNSRFLPPLSEPRNLGPAATTGEHVRAMMETEGWKALEEAIEGALHFEQRALMAEAPGRPDANYERKVGQWSGLRMAVNLASELVSRGEKASQQMRAAERAA